MRVGASDLTFPFNLHPQPLSLSKFLLHIEYGIVTHCEYTSWPKLQPDQKCERQQQQRRQRRPSDSHCNRSQLGHSDHHHW
ncbi:hypothetical protein PM082_023394 [Marasmius tenuissimus]|nr:hypothetical protein PM082_023394 [Marasmius tenuissimus]